MRATARRASYRAARRGAAQGEPLDWLFVLTDWLRYCLLAYEPATGTIVTRVSGADRRCSGRAQWPPRFIGTPHERPKRRCVRALTCACASETGDAEDRHGYPAERGPLAVIDPEGRVIAMHLYSSMLKIVRFLPGLKPDAMDTRVPNLAIVLDAVFLHGCPKPTLAILSHDPQRATAVKSYDVSGTDGELIEALWQLDGVEDGAMQLVALPRPIGGVLVFGEQHVTFYNGTERRSVAIPPAETRCHCMIDARRHLLSDQDGNVIMVLLVPQGSSAGGVMELKQSHIGTVNAARCMAYLDNAFVFIGSQHADSQLVRIRQDLDEHGSCIEVAEQYDNLGPVVDMCVMGSQQEGQSCVVTCSGTKKSGTLRVLRSGIGISETAAIAVPGISGLWSLTGGSGTGPSALLVVSFVRDTRILAAVGGSLEEAEVPGFRTEAATLYCGDAALNQWLQVTATSARLVSRETKHTVAEWYPPPRHSIVAAAGNRWQLLIAVDGGLLHYIEVGTAALAETANVGMGSEVACLDISPLSDDPDARATVRFASTLSPFSRAIARHLHRAPCCTHLAGTHGVTGRLVSTHATACRCAHARSGATLPPMSSSCPA